MFELYAIVQNNVIYISIYYAIKIEIGINSIGEKNTCKNIESLKK